MTRTMQLPMQLTMAAGLGSGCGAVARWLLAAALADPTGGFPWATLLANVVGSLAIGLVAAFADRATHRLADPVMRQFLMVGICGGLTTFSVFSLEVVELGRTGHHLSAVAYIVSSVVLWLAAVWLGFALGRHLAERQRSGAASD